jgi:hypothetical protein
LQIPVEVILPFATTGPTLLTTHPSFAYVEQAAKAIHPVDPLVVHFTLAV